MYRRAIDDRRDTLRTALIAAPGLLVLLAQWIAVRPVFVDDAYIFYRYAGNWADGLGPVFNRGEYVEGFSSFLWLVALTVPAALGLAPEDVGPVLGLVAAAGLVALAAAAARLLSDSALLAACVALAVAIPTGLPYYAASGMDAPLFALVLLATVVATACWVERARAGEGDGRAAVAPGALLVALVLVRAEGPAYALVIAGLAALLAAGSWRRGARAAIPLLAAAATATVAVLAARVAVYGELVPATVSAKSTITHLASEALRDPSRLGDLTDALREGARYVGGLLLAVAALAALGLAWQRRRREPIPPLVLIAAAVAGLSIAVGIYSGGDWMPHRRLLVPALPLLALVAAWTAARGAAGRGREPLARLAAGVIACAIVAAATGVDPRRIRHGDRPPAADQLEDIGRAAAADPGAGILTNVAGVLPYRAGSDHHVWDLLGLTDRHNATRGQDYFLSYGRTDYDYSVTRPFDLFVTNSPRDVEQLFRRIGPAERAGRLQYLASRAWTGQGLTVIVRRGRPLALSLARTCRCPALPLTARNRGRILARVQASGPRDARAR